LKVDDWIPPILIEEVVMKPLSLAKAPRLFGRLIVRFPEEVDIEKAFEDDARAKVNVGPATWLIVVVPGAEVIYPESFVNWEIAEVVSEYVTFPDEVVATVSLLPERKLNPRLVLAVDVFVRSLKLFAAMSWRALLRLPRPIFVRALEVELRSERLLAIRRAPAVEVI
jgi:hypothetical protein